jgi:hypothetical protein
MMSRAYMYVPACQEILYANFCNVSDFKLQYLFFCHHIPNAKLQ